MNAPPSDGSESSIDIFVLSKNQTEVPARMAPLEQMGYRITLFDDPPTLIESLHDGKPNLLICDTLSFPEAYDLCRHVKDSNDLWVIPVLILTGASDLSDLLHILDCNADNYIAYPYDPDYFLSLIEGMLSTPVERQTPEQIKTQFKIQHDDRIFVVTADRRKLLEFLLSSFEITVSKFHDLSRANDEIHVLSDDVNRLEMFVAGQKQSFEELDSSLRQKEQENSILEEIRHENEQALLGRTGEIDQLTRDLESDKKLLGAAEEQLRNLIRDKDESERQSGAEISLLRQQVTTLSADSAATTAELEESRKALTLEKSGRAGALVSLAETTQQKELAEKSARALTLENEQMKISLAAEKNRAVAAEQEIRSVLHAKTESEQDLTVIINELKETAKQQASDLYRQKAEMEDGKTHILNLEIQLGNLKTEKEKIESDLRSTTEHLQHDLAGAREKLDATQAIVDEKDLDNERLTVSYNGIIDERNKTDAELQALSQELHNVQHALEQEKERHQATDENLNIVIRERDAAFRSLQGSHQSIQADLAEHRDNLAQARDDLASASAHRSTLERDLESATTGMRELESRMHSETASREQALQQVRSLSDELEGVKAALENERRLHHATVESLRSSALEKERYERDLQTLSDQLASVQSSLDSEKELRTAAASEREDLRRNLMAAEEQGRSQEATLAATIEALKADLSSATCRQLELEGQVQALSHEKRLADDKTASLAAEIDQARTALADEWEDHMNDQERLTATAREKQQLEKSLSQQDAPEAEKARKRALIIKGPDLPMEIGTGSRALTNPRVPDEPLPDVKRITGVEDLFEDDEPAGEPDTTPRVSIIQEPSGDVEWTPPDLLQYPGEIQSTPFGEESPGDGGAIQSEADGPDEVTGDEVTEDDDSNGEVAEDGSPEQDGNDADEDTSGNTPSPGESTESIPPGISFNRAQWFDLLKWAHHSGALTPEQRMQIVRMGRLIQKGRKLTRKQNEQVREMIVLVQALGYRFS
jgi:DNA-binding response OmpR family regulator/predicted  nucleic acid-binding Zn-ribbon protein